MRHLASIFLFLLWSLAGSAQALDQNVEPKAEPEEEFADGKVTAREWRARVDVARRRYEEFVAGAKAKMSDVAQSGPKTDDERVMSDPSLKRGDIISTSKGLFVFVGRDDILSQDGSRQNDFAPSSSLLVPIQPPAWR